MAQRRRTAKKVTLPKAEQVTITKIGGQGDGLAKLADGTMVFVPYVLAGEDVLVTPVKKRGSGLVALPTEIIKSSPDRQNPVCKHFTDCGGCKTQHMPTAMQGDLKKQQVKNAFFSYDINAPVGDTVRAEGLRRRARFNVMRTGKGYTGGFHRSESHKIVELQECKIIAPAVWKAFQDCLELLTTFDAPNKLDVHITAGDNGVEVVFYPFDNKDISLDGRFIIAEKTKSLGWVAVHWHYNNQTDAVCVLEPVKIQYDSVTISLPSSSFLQPTKQGQEILQNIVISAINESIDTEKKKKRIADLYAGSGCFSFPMIQFGSVDAFEINERSIQSMHKVSANHPINSYVRNLELDPLMVDECDAYDCIILDPPRAGANVQCDEISGSKCPLVIYISCNPAALAKDTLALTDGGYRLQSVTPVDQFLYSNHIESVAIFKK